MIKLHNDHASAALIALRYMLAQGMTLSDIALAVERLGERGAGNGTRNSWDRWIINDAAQMRINRTTYDLNKAINEIASVLYGTPERRGGNLIESMAKILSGDFARNRFSQETVRTLREALLLPDEIAATYAVDEANIHCSGCGQKFEEGDALTLRAAAFMCNRCAPIHNVKCKTAGCEERTQIKNWSRIMQADSCQTHKGGGLSTPAVAAEPATPEETLRQLFTANLNEVTEAPRIQWERLANGVVTTQAAIPRRRP